MLLIKRACLGEKVAKLVQFLLEGRLALLFILADDLLPDFADFRRLAGRDHDTTRFAIADRGTLCGGLQHTHTRIEPTYKDQ
jgi:hypothetical protein